MAANDPTISRQGDDALTPHVAACLDWETAFFRTAGMQEKGAFASDDEAKAREHSVTERIWESAEASRQELLRRGPDFAEAYARERHQRLSAS
jgi:hypothetical protein